MNGFCCLKEPGKSFKEPFFVHFFSLCQHSSLFSSCRNNKGYRWLFGVVWRGTGKRYISRFGGRWYLACPTLFFLLFHKSTSKKPSSMSASSAQCGNPRKVELHCKSLNHWPAFFLRMMIQFRTRPTLFFMQIRAMEVVYLRRWFFPLTCLFTRVILMDAIWG